MNHTLRPYCESFAPGGCPPDGPPTQTGEDGDKEFADAGYGFSGAPR